MPGKSIKDTAGTELPQVSIMTIGSLFGKRSKPNPTEADRAQAQGALAEILHARKAGGKTAQTAKIREILARS